jgi:predicted DsbA family dithiol-disulfide isomerase
MKVEIWSDVMCPFCYIGKRRFETALGQFNHKEEIEIVWKSFQLNPDMKTDPSKNINQYLAEVKGWSEDQAREMNDHVTQMAAHEGLEYNFDKAIVANSFDAHRFIQLAKSKRLGDQAEERLFKAYFTEGLNTDDHGVLIQLGKEIGLDETEVKTTLESNAFANEVNRDIAESRQVGVRGVPFFVLNRKYAVSGAQSAETFLGALTTSFGEWKEENPTPLEVIEGPACTPGEIC